MSARGLSRQSLSRMRPLERVNLLALVVTAVAGCFIVTGSVPLLFLLPILTGLGLDGILRNHPARRLAGTAEAATRLLLPATFVVAAALFFRYVASGYWEVLAALATGAAFAVLGYAEYACMEADTVSSGAPRIVLLAAAYAGLYGLLGALYAFDLSPVAAAVLAGIAAAIFAVELFREADLTPPELASYSLAAGLVVAQVRWAAAFIALDGLLAALLLLLVFYVVTGLALAGLTRRLDRRIALEYLAAGVVGLVITVAGRAVTGR